MNELRMPSSDTLKAATWHCNVVIIQCAHIQSQTMKRYYHHSILFRIRKHEDPHILCLCEDKQEMKKSLLSYKILFYYSDGLNRCKFYIHLMMMLFVWSVESFLLASLFML